MDDYNIIVKPLVTEQGMHLANVRSAYSFEVNRKANKVQIKHAIQRLYGVEVEKVRTANCRGKLRRRGRSIGITRAWKKAVVYLKGEHHIDLF
jgi:large subunit ribosomal protein L23